MSFWWHFQAFYCSYHAISSKVESQIVLKIPDFGYPLCTRSGIPCYEERHPLLLKYFITFLRHTQKVRGASDTIYNALRVHIVSLLLVSTLKDCTKLRIRGTLSARVMGCHAAKERHPLLLKCFISFLKCIRRYEELLISYMHYSLCVLCHFN